MDLTGCLFNPKKIILTFSNMELADADLRFHLSFKIKIIYK
jgi:hypothetical protein